jgi:hypothetical protein
MEGSRTTRDKRPNHLPKPKPPGVPCLRDSAFTVDIARLAWLSSRCWAA